MAAWDNIPFVDEPAKAVSAWESVPFADEPVVEKQPTLGERFEEETKRQQARTKRMLGLGARAALTGVTALPHLAGDVANRVLNLIPGVNLGMPSERFQETMTGYGLPAPESGPERFAHTLGSAGVGGGLQMGVANALAQTATSPVTRNIMSLMASNPRLQLESLIAGSTAQQTAAEAGGGPAWQVAAGLTGAALPGVGRAAVNVVRPSAATPAGARRLANVQALAAEDVSMTPGQIVGGAAQRVEDAWTSIPWLGDAIKSAKRSGLETFDRAAINRSLRPIGENLPRHLVGREAIEHASERLDNAYNTLLSRMYGDMDPQLTADLARIRQMGQQGRMAPQQAGELERIIDNEIIDRFTQGGRISGERVKDIESKLGHIVRISGRSENYDVRQVGTAVMEMQDALRRMVARINPSHADELQRINSGYANLLRAQTAAARQGAKEGIFTANQYASAVREMDPSKRHSAYARGTALGQDLSDAGVAVLPQTVPDSGTPFRYLLSHPMRASLWGIPGIAASALYSDPGMALAQRLLLGQRQNPLGGIPAITNVLAGIDQGGQ